MENLYAEKKFEFFKLKEEARNEIMLKSVVKLSHFQRNFWKLFTLKNKRTLIFTSLSNP